MKLRQHTSHWSITALLVTCVASSIWMLATAQVRLPRRATATQSSATRSATPAPAPSTANPDAPQDPSLLTDSVPDSLAHPRWPVQHTTPITWDDLEPRKGDLVQPEGIRYDVSWNDSLQRYIIGTRIGSTYLAAPIMMTTDEYLQWSERQGRNLFFRTKNNELVKTKGREKFDFTDMHFDLGPAEKIFGPGGVRIKTQGSAELRMGATFKNVDNPALPIRRRRTVTVDFDEKINLNVTGKVGDKVNLGLNYNTDATFDFDAQNLKLRYEGKEDEIIKLVEGGNISFPTNSSLVQGASSLFGLRTDLQFGKLKLQLVASQKKSSSRSVSSRGGKQLTAFEMDAANYEENRHFFLGHFFRRHYDEWMATLPTIRSGVTIGRVEVWVTNKTGNTSNTRDIVALTDLGEGQFISSPLWQASGTEQPDNAANTEYATLVNSLVAARDLDQTAGTLEAAGMKGGQDFEKLESARLLDASEYTVNQALGTISLRNTLQTDQVLAVAYEYTFNGVTHQVGEFASDQKDTGKALFVKALKNTAHTPNQGNWRLMMKNVYFLASTVEKDKFRLNIKYQSDTTGVYLTYLPEEQVKSQTLIRVMGADRLDNNLQAHANGSFDFVEGYTVQQGRVFLPQAEPFGASLLSYLQHAGLSKERAAKYAFTELYDSTKTVARQVAEKDKFILQGQYSGTQANVISLGAYNVPQGSVVVTAGGVRLTEGSDYTVDYSAGEVTILNQSIIDAGTAVNVSMESQTDFGMERKTMMGLNWEYDLTRNLSLGGTLQHLSEQSLTTKVNMGQEPVSNTIWGMHINWKHESQWLTRLLDRLPGLHLTQPSRIDFTGEVAQLIAGQASGLQDNASYLDDFESAADKIDISNPTSWVLSSVPTLFHESSDKTTLSSGYGRARLAWYTIDPLFTNRGSSLTPGHIKSDLEQLSDPNIRAVYAREIFPKRDANSYNGSTSTLQVLNLAYYPSERGPYNFFPQLTAEGKLPNPETKWGGMMRKLETSDFETANIEYVEFWLMDPFTQTAQLPNAKEYGGDLYFDLGEVSEDILKDGKKSYESGLPVDGSNLWTTTQWGKIPTQATTTYAFATSSGSRQLQDLGYNGLTDEEERHWEAYQNFLTQIQGKVNAAVWDSIYNDPAADNYHYFRGTDLDQMRADILRRYKYINNPQGNSPDSESRGEAYDTSYKTTPDVEDINQDYTLNEYERYYQYHVSLRPEDMVVGKNYIVDKRETSPTLRNNKTRRINWYLFRIPLRSYDRRVGGISDFSSMRFIRTFLTGCQHPLVLRFATLNLVRGTWRSYQQNLDNAAAQTGSMSTAAVSFEENSDKTPVNYVMPPGIRQEQDPTQPQLTESDEQALMMNVETLAPGEAKAIYKNTTVDLREFKRLQMFVHANAFEPNITQLQDNQLAFFIRLGSDYKSNYYEYQIPLKLTPASEKPYNNYSEADRRIVWPEENMLDVPLALFTQIKRERNRARGQGLASFTRPYSAYDEQAPANKVTVMGNPTLGEVKVMVMGVRNLATEQKSGEVWANELRLLGTDNSGGWAAQGNLNVQLSDLGTVNIQGRHVSAGFGGLEQSVTERTKDDVTQMSLTTSVELGKFFPDKARVSAPLYYSVTKEVAKPKYNPLDTDVRLKEALDFAATPQERDSIDQIAVTRSITTNLSLSNVRVGIQTKRHPMPWDPANFAFSYSHAHSHTQGQTTVYENEDQWRGGMNYSWSPSYKAWEPFAKLKNKSKWLDLLRRFGLNWLPQSVNFSTEIARSYYELQERDMEATEQSQLPVTWSSQFLWNRQFQLRWDLTKNLHASFQSATNAEIEQPYTPVNKNLYPDHYSAWKDSVWQSIKSLGTPLDYQQTLTLTYQPPLQLLPALDWLQTDVQYTSHYGWVRGATLEDSTSLGNTITMNRNLNLNGNLNLVKLYNHWSFLRKANERFDRDNSASKNRQRQQERLKKQQERRKRQEEEAAVRKKAQEEGRDPEEAIKELRKNEAKAQAQKKALPLNKQSWEQETTLRPDTAIVLAHNKKTKRITVTARTPEGKTLEVKWKHVDANKIKLLAQGDSAQRVKITVTAKKPLEEQAWYRTAQTVARAAMMIRTLSLSYRSQYSLSLPGFLPMAGDVFGQKRQDKNGWAPGVGFAFGLANDDYVQQAADRGWLLMDETTATPATSSQTEDLQLRATLEPVRTFKIDLTGTRTLTRARSMQYMYVGTPTMESGNFAITTTAIGTAFEGMGSAKNGYHSSTFERFCRSLDEYRQRVENRYKGTIYPVGTTMAGKPFNPANGTVNKYSGDVMIPAFLHAYTTSGSDLSLFPSLKRLLPNWSVRYSGLGKLPWLSDLFRSVNLSHAYRCTYTVGAYQSFSTFASLAGSDMGFVTDATTGAPTPSSMYNISVVTLNEAFSPLLGLDVTLLNNMTAKVEYRQTRVLALSMTSIQLNEAVSKDWVVGLGYRINNFDLFGPKPKKTKRSKNAKEQKTSTSSSSQTNRDLNLRLDLSLRKQAALTRDIATMTSTASSGNTAFKLSFMADYTFSRFLTLSFFLDRQTTTPLLTSSSYPTTTQDFGLSVKFSLTR